MKELEEILLEFQAHGLTPAKIEFALDLDYGSIEKALLTDDPIMITLLKVVRTYPWLLEIAEHGYDGTESERILLHNAVNVFINEKHNKKLKGAANGTG